MNLISDSAKSGRIVPHHTPEHQTGHRLNRRAGRGVYYGFRGIGAATSVMLGNGPYQNVTEIVSDIHALVIKRLDPQPGLRW